MGSTTSFALKEVDFQLQRGELTAVMGTSGSGKSTLMNIIGFLDRCTTGQYHFDGQCVTSLSEFALTKIRNQRIGFIFQSFHLLARANALQNVMLPLFYRGIHRNQARHLAMEMLEKVGMHAMMHHMPSQLSGGQQQRVAIARALVGNPDIVLADEPTGALDSRTGQDVMNLLIGLHRQESRTVLIITHDKQVSQHCERVVMLKDGKIIDY